MSSPFAGGVFTLTDLAFTTPDGGSTLDEFGNPVPTSVTLTVTAYLKPTSDPRLVALAGADQAMVTLRGRCVTPMTLPLTLQAGSLASATIRGRPGVFKLAPPWPASIQAVEDALGEPILGAWRAQ